MGVDMTKVGEVLRKLTGLVVEESPRQRLKAWTVVSAIDDEIYGPFSTPDEALALASSADGSVFELSIKVR
jgi:hypothetical protein